MDVQADGSFVVSYDVDGGAARQTQVYEKTGKALGEPTVKAFEPPAPEPIKLAPEVEAKINALAAEIEAANNKIAELNGWSHWFFSWNCRKPQQLPVFVHLPLTTLTNVAGLVESARTAADQAHSELFAAKQAAEAEAAKAAAQAAPGW